MTAGTPSGWLRFSCGSNPALRVNHDGVVFPTFTLPSNGMYKSINLVAAGGDCSGAVPFFPLTSGQTMTFVGSDAGKSFDYCVSYDIGNVQSGATPDLSVTWQQNQP